MIYQSLTQEILLLFKLELKKVSEKEYRSLKASLLQKRTEA